MHIKCMAIVLFVLCLSDHSWAVTATADLLVVPFTPTPTGIQAFFTNVFNAPLYAKEVFPNSTIHLEQLLSIGRKEHLPIEYTTTVLWLFHVKAIEARYINAEAFEPFIDTLVNLLSYHLQTTTDRTVPKELIKNSILTAFAHDAEQIATNPAQFFDTMAEELLKKLQPWIEQEQGINLLRHTLTMLLHTMITKMVWDVTNPLLWQQIKKVGTQLTTLEKEGIIDKQQLNTLFWSLILRICYLIELQASVIPLDVYQEMISDITTSDHPLLRLVDAEPNMTSKAEKLRQVILDSGAVARAQARTEYGIIS